MRSLLPALLTISHSAASTHGLTNVALVSPEIEKALAEALEKSEETQKLRFESALRNCRRRTKAQEADR